MKNQTISYYRVFGVSNPCFCILTLNKTIIRHLIITLFHSIMRMIIINKKPYTINM